VEEVLAKFVPSKIASMKDTGLPPWLSHKLKQLIKRRDRLSRKALKSGNPRDKSLFREARTKAKKEMSLAYNIYISSLIGDIQNAPRKFYKFINSKRTENRGISSLQHNNVVLLDDDKKAATLNGYFSSVFTRENLDFVPFSRSHFPSMSSINISTTGVTKLLMNLNINKAKGPDGISPFILKSCAEELSPMLMHIFSQSLQTSCIPNDWRDANIVPLHKKGRQDLADNYRPVSLTCITSKIIEHIVYSSVAHHLESNSILTPAQHGFRPGHSCETQLVLAVDDWSKAIDNRERVDVAILDFSKAFDSVPHERLKSKLHYYGIRGDTLSWIAAFLYNRRQRVLLNGVASDWSRVVSGVPQGTVLGPLLFLLYVNDITEGVLSHIRLFADDCVLYKSIASSSDSDILQDDLTRLVSWSDKWQMSFNIKKCSMMHLMRRKKQCSLPMYTMKGIPLTVVSSHSYLLVEIQSDLRWNDHIDKIIKKASKTLGMVRRNLSGCNKNIKSLAYTSLVRPSVEYASSVWDPYLSKHIQQLEMIQRRSARFVHADYRYSSSPSAMIDNLKWQKLETRRKIARLSLFFKASNGKVAFPLDKLRKPSRQSRSSGPQAFTQIGVQIGCTVMHTNILSFPEQ